MSNAPATEQLPGTRTGEPRRSTGARRHRAVAALGFSQAVDNSESGLIQTFFPLIRTAFGLDYGALGILTSLSKFARMIFGPVWAMAADRFGRKRVMFLVTGVWGIFTLAAGFAPDYTTLLVVYGISTVGAVASEPILNGLLPDLFKSSERGKAYGLVRGIGGGVGVVLGPAVGIFGSDPDGWRYAMWVMGAVSIVSGFMILAWVPKPEKRSVSIAADPESGTFKISDALKLFRIPTFSLIALMIPLVTSVAVLGFYSTFLVDDRGYSVPESAVIMAIYNIGVMFSSFLGGFLGDRFDRLLGAKGRVLLMQIYLVAFAMTVWFVTGFPADGRWFVYPASFLLGLVFSVGFSGCVLPIVSTVVPMQLAATSFAVLFSLIQGGISALFAVFAGTIADAIGLTGTFFWFMTVPYLANALLWFAFYKTYPRDRAKQEARTAAVYDGAI